MEIPGGKADKLAHPTINMHPKNLDLETAIGFAPQAGRTLTTRKIRFDRAACSARQSLLILANRYHLNAKLMPKNTRIAEKGLITLIGMQISTAHSNLPDPDQRFSRSRRSWLFLIEQAQLARLFQNNCFHLFFPLA